MQITSQIPNPMYRYPQLHTPKRKTLLTIADEKQMIKTTTSSNWTGNLA